ncbi:MAG: ketoacyl-ACP synthase III, partial [Deltaproteobacteria bacterium]|nr:ketoacyl-ACP synthase III [Deltaproteobacteria bacterium]
ARQAIKNAGLSPADIDGIVVGTVTPDYAFPSTACRLQHRLGIQGCLAFDVVAVCSGFLYAFTTADSLIASGQCRNVLVVGVDLFSTILDKNDRSTIMLFGDGAGAMVLTAASPEEHYGSRFVFGDGSSLRGVLATELGADGQYGDLLACKFGSAARLTPELISSGAHWMTMEGKEVFKHATRKLAAINISVCEKAGFSVDQVDYFVTHQANKRIVDSMTKQLGVSEQKVLSNIARYGNTSAASVPLLLCEAESEGTIKNGDLIAISAFGAGFTWGAALIRW